MDRPIVGNLARDAEVETVGNWQRTKLIVLENTGRMSRGEWVKDDAPTRHLVYVWRDMGVRCAGLHEGDSVMVYGREHTQSWIDKETGEKRQRRVIDAEHVGPDLRHMETKARRAQRPDMVDEALNSWATVATTQPTIARANLGTSDLDLILEALDAWATEQEQQAGAARAAEPAQIDYAKIQHHEQQRDFARTLADRLRTANRVLLETRGEPE